MSVNAPGVVDLLDRQLRAGQRIARSGLPGSTDFIDACVIDARLRQIDALRRSLYPDGRIPPDG